MPNNYYATCSACGHKWVRGTDGSHSCVEHLTAYIAELELQLETKKTGETPRVLSRWQRSDHDDIYGKPMVYTVTGIANVGHDSPLHPPEVIYQGRNGYIWTMPLCNWPDNLVPEDK